MGYTCDGSFKLGYQFMLNETTKCGRYRTKVSSKDIMKYQPSSLK